MRNLKRALSLALASVMLLGMMVVGASAASYPDVSGEDNVEAIEVLNAVNVMIGDRGNFRPDAAVNRHEMAVIMAKLYLGSDEADNYVGTHPFTDVYPWADKYVAACYENNLISGTSSTTYGGSQPLTAVQAALMMLRALGYENLNKGAADWRAPVAAKANQIKLFTDVVSSPNAQLTRNQVAQLALNTLKADVVTTRRVLIAEGGQLDNEFAYDRVEITTETKNYSVASGSNSAAATDTGYGYQQLCEKLYGTDLRLKGGKEDDLGRNASTWVYKSDDVITVADEADYVFVLDDDCHSDELLDTLKDLIDNDDLDATGADYVLNGADSDADGIEAKAVHGTTLEVYLDPDDSDTIEKVVAYYYTLDKITDVDDDVTTADAKKGVACYVEFEGLGETINNDKIAGFDIDTYEADTYVAIIANEDGDEIIASYIPDVVESSVRTVEKTGKYITASGERYYPAASYGDSVETITLDTTNVSTKSDDSYAIYVDANGYMLGLKEIEASSASLKDVYYLDAVYKGAEVSVPGADARPSYWAQVIALADGTIEQVELELKDHSLPDSKNDLSNTTDYTNFDALTNLLVTISDKKGDDGSKANNGKYNLTVWDHDANEDYDVYTAGKFIENDELKVSSTRVDVNGKLNGASAGDHVIRLNKSTNYVFAEDTGEDLAASMVTGGVAYKFDKDNLVGSAGTYSTYAKAIVITEADKRYALYMIIPCEDAGQSDSFSEDVIFIKDADSKVEGDGFFSVDVYLADGTKVGKNDKNAWEFDEDVTLTSGEFYTYAENKDGFIEVEDADALTDNDYVWDDETGWISGKVDPDSAWDQGLMTITTETPKTIEDIKVAGAKIVDLHDTDDEYDREIKTLARLQQLLDDEKIEDVVVAMNVSKDGVATIFLLEAPAVAPPAPTYAVTCNVSGTITDSSAGTKTFTVSADKSSAEENDTVTLTITLGAAVPTDKKVTVTFSTPTGITPVEIAADANSGTATFSMPAEAVTVAATAAETSA